MKRPRICAENDETTYGVEWVDVTVRVDFRLGDHLPAMRAFERAVADVRQQIEQAAYDVPSDGS